MKDLLAHIPHLLAAGHLTDDEPWLVLYDLGLLDARFQELRAAWPADTLHANAIKANPLVSVLRRLARAGAGMEAASRPELMLAEAAGCAPEAIVYDSPAKSRPDLRYALERGVHLNADNLQELARIAELRDALGSTSTVGVRINPEVGPGRIDTTSVAAGGSKFGVSLALQRDDLIDAYRQYPWLTGIHVHVGSQGCDVDLLVAGARRAWELVEEIHAAVASDGGRDQIDVFDIGGGLPVAYMPGDDPPTMVAYTAALREAVPELFDGRVRLIIEFGRWLHAPCAIAVSRVESVKPALGADVATIHFGADLLLRRAYQPQNWDHRLTVLDPQGRPKTGEPRPHTVAGPLCFSGDVLCRARPLPPIEPGDLVVAHDVGGYSFGMWSHYCSRPFPHIVGYTEGEGFSTLRTSGSVESARDFWS